MRIYLFKKKTRETSERIFLNSTNTEANGKQANIASKNKLRNGKPQKEKRGLIWISEGI